jgi:hypothetical protein
MFLTDIHSSDRLKLIHKIESTCLYSKLKRPNKLLESVASCSGKAELSARLIV